MKKIISFCLYILIIQNCFSQSVGIGTTTPNTNAILDVSSTTKGMLVPRMDSVKRKLIPNTIGMLVFDTTTKTVWYNDGVKWVNLIAGSGGSTGISINITTQAVTNVAPTTAVCGGSITSDGGAAITARGVVWSTSPSPTIALATKTNDGTGVGSYSSNITGLTLSTTYYVRAYATNANGTTYGNQVTFITAGTFSIGQNYGGGIIFYIDNTGQHGLIVSPEDLSTGIAWRNNVDIVTNATGLAIGTGGTNTTTIIAAQGNGSYAASLCRIFYTGGGFTDWYLPSLYELNQLFLKRVEAGIGPYSYWSSSETTQFSAWSVDFFQNGPNQLDQSKMATIFVRAIRKF